MALEFDDIFASVGVRRRKKQRNTLIDGCVIRIAKASEGGAPGKKLGINQAGEQGAKARPRDADYRHTTATGRGGNCGYNVICHAPAWRSPSRA